MSYLYGNREQMELFPKCIEDYISKDDPVRVYDAFVEALNLDELELTLDDNQVGAPSYDPKTMLKLLVYGYSYGIRSSRKLERAVHHNLSFIWLMGGLTPDHKTIANYRRNNLTTLKKVLKESVRLCMKLNLIDGNTLFVDGTKIRASAGIKNTWTKEKCEEYLKKIDKHIDIILQRCEQIDSEEEKSSSIIKVNEEIERSKNLKEKVKGILDSLKEEEKKSVNTVDPECTRINSINGSHAGYNAQIVVDDKNGLIVNSDVVSENNDLKQFSKQINQANDNLGKKCSVACADSGYATTEELKKIDDRDIKVIVPSQRQAAGREKYEFAKENFKYNSEKDCYFCPAGRCLEYLRSDNNKNNRIYRIKDSSVCHNCRYYGRCTKSRVGRTINRILYEDIKTKLELQYKEAEAQEIYKRRMEKAEHPFGHIKRNLNVNSFLLRGLDGAKAEVSLFASCFNIRRMITLIGTEMLVLKFAK